jgi:hypothetical protein
MHNKSTLRSGFSYLSSILSLFLTSFICLNRQDSNDMSVTQTLFSEKREKTKNSTNPDNICKQKIPVYFNPNVFQIRNQV